MIARRTLAHGSSVAVPPPPGQSDKSGVRLGPSSLAASPRRAPAAHGESLTELYRESGAIVARHYRRPLTVAVVARAVASSPRQLQRAFIQVGGTTFSADLRDVRLANAAQLLAAQPLTVRQVALLVGYRQPPHLAKAFRRRYGVTPAEYRELARRARRRRPTTTQEEQP